jgi:hypothetical protein
MLFMHICFVMLYCIVLLYTQGFYLQIKIIIIKISSDMLLSLLAILQNNSFLFVCLMMSHVVSLDDLIF